MSDQDQNRLQALKQQKEQLDQAYEKKLKEERATREQLSELRYEFEKAERLKNFINIIHPRHVKQFIRTVGAYILGRRNRKQLYSKTYKQKQATNDLKPYIYALYNEGFITKVLSDLLRSYNETKNVYLKRAIGWELALWYANQQTADSATEAIPYLNDLKHEENNPHMVRKIAILEAECHTILQKKNVAKQVLLEACQTDIHPDLYLALANVESSLHQKLAWINQTLKHYDLSPIDCHDEIAIYDHLRMKTTQPLKDGPKVSVILPAYNSEEGIKTAIESILTQTWKNIELLIVDDCSTDHTLKVIEDYANKDSRIKVLSTKENSGPYVARNIALEEATGEFVTVHDADDWSHTEKIDIQVNHLMNHPNIIANTSEQARLTEDITFYRRGTPGKYIFSNMSSLMFRRKQVVESIGYWDTVRFAADGEFKRRLIKSFGKDAVVDLKTGPLSFPRQLASSLTGSSAFGYDGFFMGARKEYVESFSFYHQQAQNLYYPATQEKRLFPVPEPLLPKRHLMTRSFDIVMVADFYQLQDRDANILIQELKRNKQLGLRTALVQMSHYDLTRKRKTFNQTIRSFIDGNDIQMVVYGEKVSCKLLIVRTPAILNEWQKYIPTIRTIAALIIIDELPLIEYNSNKELNYNVRQSLHHLMAYFGKSGRWYPLNDGIRKTLEQKYTHEFRFVSLAHENWINKDELREEQYTIRLKDWLVDSNDYDLK